jgi:hypothetical protein
MGRGGGVRREKLDRYHFPFTAEGTAVQFASRGRSSCPHWGLPCACKEVAHGYSQSPPGGEACPRYMAPRQLQASSQESLRILSTPLLA